MRLESAALDAALQAATVAVREYAQSAASRQVVEMLDLLVEVYATDLMSVSPEGLAAKQGAARQAIAIRDVLAAVPHAGPRI